VTDSLLNLSQLNFPGVASPCSLRILFSVHSVWLLVVCLLVVTGVLASHVSISEWV
jgi:hypothetical protein